MGFKKRRSGKGKKQKFSAAERKAFHVGYGQGLALQGCDYDVYLSHLRRRTGESFMNGVEAGKKKRQIWDRDETKIRKG